MFVRIGSAWTIKGVYSGPELKNVDCDIRRYQYFSNVAEYQQWIKTIVTDF